MNPIKKLASQTAIYGLSSIVARFLNYLLVPLHTAQFTTDQYGIITEMYAYVAFLVVLLTYGMETAFFRFSVKYSDRKNEVFSTILTSVFSTSLIFISTAIIFKQNIADWLKYPNHSEYVVWFAIIVGLDAIASIPLARLRHQNKAATFASVNLVNVGVNIGLNLFFIGYCHTLYEAGNDNAITNFFYNPNIGVGYVFISNLVATVVKFLLLIPYSKTQIKFSKKLIRELLWYSIPLLIAGLAGIVNETIDRILLKRMLFDSLGETETMSQLGIYGANYKISIIITLFIQAFRYAAEPFFFSKEKDHDSKATYAKVMNYFVMVVSAIFLGVLLYIDFIKYFIPNPAFWEGLKIVPILLLANIFLGIYYNQSIWYKMIEKTVYGAYIAIGGALITLILNIVLIPTFGYEGSAWATLVCYFSMVLASYVLGQKHFPVPYKIGKIMLYLGLAVALYFVTDFWNLTFSVTKILVHTLILIAFIFTLLIIEKKTTYES